MADSSSTASRVSSRSNNRRAVAKRLGSPVTYREGPLAYEPPVLCYCGMKAPRWISWSDDNLGHRYYRCSKARSASDCGFYMWFDSASALDFVKDLLKDLRDAVWKLRKENNELRQVAGTSDEYNSDMKMQMDLLERENLDLKQALKATEEKMHEKDALLHPLASRGMQVGVK
ncbi:hypothetical protein BS78_01G135300 [Paspalum vaginatum]|nr:hypothetical protein BS78_01G135300 [Paspalum vaginatum]